MPNLVARAAVSGRRAWSVRPVTTPGVVDRKGVFAQGPDTSKEFSAVRRRGDNSVSTPGVDTHSISKSRGYSAVRRRGDNGVSTPGVATHCSAVRRRRDDNASTPGVDATSCVDGCKRPPLKLACCRAAGLHERGCDQAGLDDACQRVQEPAVDRPQTGMSAGGINKHSSMAGPGRNASESGIHKKKRRRKHNTLRKSSTRRYTSLGPGPRLLMTQKPTVAVETLNVLTRACAGYHYKKMELKNLPIDTSELTSLLVMSWKRFAKDLYDGRIEQLCILSDRERMTSESEEVRQPFAGSSTESENTLSAKTKKERFEKQSWDSLKSSPYYEILREHRDHCGASQDKGIQHEIDLVPGRKYCVTRQWPLPREQVKAIADFFESRRKSRQVRESKSPHRPPTVCVKKPQGGWRIVHSYNKLKDATIPTQTPISRKDVIFDAMSKSTIYIALDLRDGFYQLLMRESDIPLTAVSTPRGMLWELLVMPQGLKNAPATFNRCATSNRAISTLCI
ncbi:reverse transcriptase [Phytophthora megakarya]|uniref:Reverse transcriptase n=1 Tax=Phytophthora megakarya TaxID=4795 RepID=A0A225WE73_9STRA|nr:reverse transcriptase [Phytophthora megakarya]